MSGSAGDGKPGGATRRGRGFRRVGATARAPLSAAAARHGFAETDVLLRWAEIAGEALAGLCHPVRVSYGRGRGLGATLVVRAEGARAPEVEMQAPAIVARINSFYGYRAISRLRITQATGAAGRPGGFAEAPAGFGGPPPEETVPDAASTRRAGELARDIGDPDLRAALTRMGAYVLSRTRGRERG